MRSSKEISPRTELGAMVARIKKNKDRIVQELLKKNVKIGKKVVKAKLDSGAQISIIAKDLLETLELKV